MRRAIKFSLNNANTGKLEKFDELNEEYMRAVNYYLSLLAEKEDSILSESEVKSFDSPLSYRYKQCAKRQAIKIWKVWRRTKKNNSKLPQYKGSMLLDQRLIQIENGEKSFDYWAKIATLKKGSPIYVPFKSYDYANHYWKHWDLVNGGRLQKKNGKWFLILTFEKDSPPTKEGKTKGIDIGYRKLIADSDGKFYGTEMSKLAEKGARRKHGSKRWKQTRKEIKNYVNRTAKQLFTSEVGTLVYEKLKNLKRNKKGKWNHNVNRRFNFWIYSHLISRLHELSEQHGVRVVAVPAAYTSQTCPQCGYVDSLNRNKEMFRCLQCKYEEDADYVGALNILERFTEEPIVPQVGESNSNIFL